jgi:NAD(P)-dependent dehydrogenase (short-subunit alcohol dehydrogenase family)
MEIRGRVAIVTGAGAGAGRGIALRLAAEGATVVVADVDSDGGADTARRAGGRFVPTDVTASDDLEQLIHAVQPQVLVNNAGGGGHVPPHYPEATAAQWEATLDLNLRGPMLASQLALASMREQGGGAIVNVASTAALGHAPYRSPEYAAAKAGLIRFTSSLARVDGVRVNCVVPDWILTERAERELRAMTAEERAAAPIPLSPEDVADAVVELIRDDRLAGIVMVLRGGAPRRLLDPEL